MDSYDVVTMGSATQDVFVKTNTELVTIRHAGEQEELLAFPLGTKILINETQSMIGGGGTNSATTFARQDLATGFLGKVGDDPAGRAVLDFLLKERIAFLGDTGDQTGYSVILDSQEDDRTILTFKGCNDELDKESIAHRLAMLETKWLYCSSMLKTSYATMLAVMRTVKERDGRVAFNPSTYQAKQGIGALQAAFDHTDVLILNREEAGLLVGHQSTDVKELLRVLGAAGPEIVIITDGERGAWLYNHETFLAVRPAMTKPIVETTGAGDAFGSGFIAGLARNLPVEKALLLAMLNAEHVIAEYGAKNHILTAEEADALLAADGREIVREEPGS